MTSDERGSASSSWSSWRSGGGGVERGGETGSGGLGRWVD